MASGYPWGGNRSGSPIVVAPPVTPLLQNLQMYWTGTLVGTWAGTAVFGTSLGLLQKGHSISILLIVSSLRRGRDCDDRHSPLPATGIGCTGFVCLLTYV